MGVITKMVALGKTPTFVVKRRQYLFLLQKWALLQKLVCGVKIDVFLLQKW